MKRKFIKYVIPSMIASLAAGIYSSIDGLFVGQAVGDNGIASINMAWPLFSIIIAVGIGIGMGGAVNISHHMGAGEKHEADRALGNTFTLMLIASAVLMIFTFLFARPILVLMGAEGEVLELAYGYIEVLGIGSVIQVFGSGITPLLRNQNKAWIAMVLNITNFAVDTVLSGVFVIVFDFGVRGAAFATLIGQCIALASSLYILFKKENRIPISNYSLTLKTVKNILRVGVSPFALSFIPSLTVVIMNLQVLAYGGTTALAAYSVISYMLSAGQFLLQGTADGSQPLTSFYHGAKDFDTVRKIKRWTYFISIGMSLIIATGMTLFKGIIPVGFGVSEETTLLFIYAFPICAISLLFYAFSRTATSYFYAIKKARSASLLVYSEALIVLPITSFILPKIWGLNGVWLALTIVQIIIVVVATVLLKINNIFDFGAKTK